MTEMNSEKHRPTKKLSSATMLIAQLEALIHSFTSSQFFATNEDLATFKELQYSCFNEIALKFYQSQHLRNNDATYEYFQTYSAIFINRIQACQVGHSPSASRETPLSKIPVTEKDTEIEIICMPPESTRPVDSNAPIKKPLKNHDPLNNDKKNELKSKIRILEGKNSYLRNMIINLREYNQFLSKCRAGDNKKILDLCNMCNILYEENTEYEEKNYNTLFKNK